ncbi:TY5A [Symbiodinium natans]|uniref:TY5A protein n=1 Tax=Symbiodinium natans TaxID=878477 RepID=A0A812LX19_9DINO|nr:TY5A [Symbiodinium natans]
MDLGPWRLASCEGSPGILICSLVSESPAADIIIMQTRASAVVYLSAARSFSGPSPVQEHTAEVAELLEDEDPGIRFWALETLANQGFASAPQAAKLQKALEDSDPNCRVAAANAVSKAAPELQEEAAKVLARALNKHEDKIFRKSGAEGLGYLGEAAMKYLPQIITTLQQDDYPLARSAAAAALGQLGAAAVAKAAEPLAQRLSDAEQDVRGACRGSLRKLDVAMVTFPACTLKLSDT